MRFRLGAEDGRLVLAAAEGAHAAIARQRAETLPVLDRAQVTGQIGLAADVVPILVAGRPDRLTSARTRKTPTIRRWSCSCRRPAASRSSARCRRRGARRESSARMRRATVIG